MVVTDAIVACTTGSAKRVLEPTIPTVYSTRMSPYCMRVRLLLNVKEIPFQIVNISIWQKPEWIHGITLGSQVPIFQESDGRALKESLIIAQYIEEQHNGKKNTRKLLPTDPYKKAHELLLLDRIMQAVADPVRNVAMKGDELSAKALLNALEQVNDILEDDFFAGSKMGFVDLMVYPWFDRSPAYLKNAVADIFAPEHKLQKLLKWRERMLSDPAVRLSSYPDACYTASLQSRRSGKPTPDVGLDIQKCALEKI